MQYPLLEILNARDVGNIKVFLQHKIGARNFSGGRTQVKFQLTRGWNETWCEIKEIRPELYSLKVYFIQLSGHGYLDGCFTLLSC